MILVGLKPTFPSASKADKSQRETALFEYNWCLLIILVIIAQLLPWDFAFHITFFSL